MKKLEGGFCATLFTVFVMDATVFFFRCFFLERWINWAEAKSTSFTWKLINCYIKLIIISRLGPQQRQKVFTIFIFVYKTCLNYNCQFTL
jgi:hypothetical protein